MPKTLLAQPSGALVYDETMHGSRRRAYYDATAFPQLAAVQAAWPTLRTEARSTLDALGHYLGGQATSSYILPLRPEAEDRTVYPDELYAKACALAPETTRLVSAVPYVMAFAYSRLQPGKHIPLHEHWNPNLVAILCLQDGGNSHIIVDEQRRDFHDGEIIVFDYTLPHESKNEGAEERIVLLMIIDPKKARASQAQTASR